MHGVNSVRESSGGQLIVVICLFLSTFGSSSLYLNDERRHTISYAQRMFRSSVYEGALGIIARRDIENQSVLSLDVDPLIT